MVNDNEWMVHHTEGFEICESGRTFLSPSYKISIVVLGSFLSILTISKK